MAVLGGTPGGVALVVAVGVAAGLLGAACWRWALRRLVARATPEHPDFSRLDDRSGLIAAATTTGATGLLLALAWAREAVAPTAIGVWGALGVAGTVSALIDLRTTWLPLTWMRVCWTTTATGVVALAVADPPAATIAVLGGLVSAGALWAVRLVSRGAIAFGDVRLALVTGATAASLGPDALLLAWWATAVLGAVGAVAWRLATRRTVFPYGPALWLGPWVALAERVVAI